MIRVFVVEDHAVVRDGLRYAFSQTQDMAVAGEAVDGGDALRQMRAGNFDFDIVLLDIGLPDQSGLALLAQIRQEAPQLPVLVLSSFAENEFARQVLNDGAQGYVAKGADARTITGAIRLVAGGGSYLSPDLIQTLAARGRHGGGVQFSAREYEILLSLANGKGLTEIGRELNLSAKTVSTYRARILEKTGLNSNADLTRFTLARGWIT